MNLKEWIDVIKRNLGRGLFPHQTSFTLVLPLRRLILSPEQLADRLHLNGASQVLEVGPGPGYFSVEIARRLLKGRLELFDLQKEMLEKTRRRLETAGLRNVGFTQGDACNLPYSEDQFDVVFLVA
ncbi:MAG: class I SAM-dependent methyltransferase, partial [Anaerolineae bacterium]|nr:class I SAM-dependent methyltransferase [Anaerolineae bacterium]